MAAPWFFVESMPAAGGIWPLSRDEAKHATGAKRLAPGDAVVLFDGRGRVAEATLGNERSRDGSLAVVVQGVREIAPTGRRVHLVTALPKGDRLSTLIDMVTQLGVRSVTPLRCERSVVGGTDARADRMRRIMIEACKQARVAWLPELHDEVSVDEIARRARPTVLLHPGGESLTSIARTLDADLTLCVGPEGGFTESERTRLLAAGARQAAVGESILRIETAAVVGVAALRLA